MKITMLIAALSAGLLALGVQTSVHAGEIASDSFDSYSGSIGGGSGGAGAWTGNWVTAGANSIVQSSNILSYSGGDINVNGGSQSLQHSLDNVNPYASRTFAAQSGVLYFSVLLQMPTTATNEYLGLHFTDSATNPTQDNSPSLELGIYGTTGGNSFLRAVNYNAAGARGSNGTNYEQYPYTNGDTVFVIGRISDEGDINPDAGVYDRIELFVNPTTAVQPGSATIASNWDTALTSLDTVAWRPANFAGSEAVYLDELRIGTDWASVIFHAGDANYDGIVNLADLQILGDNWQSTTATWGEADFTGDGNVNLADLQILGDNWGYGASPDLAFDEALALVNVPEPSGLALLGAMGALIAGRRMKR